MGGREIKVGPAAIQPVGSGDRGETPVGSRVRRHQRVSDKRYVVELAMLKCTGHRVA